jgi:hypothetical protein
VRVAGTMAEDENETIERVTKHFSIKDALIAVPFLSSALALTWEVGYFFKIRGGAFGLFSVTEHLTFALQALPIALALTTAGMVGLIRDDVLNSAMLRSAAGPRVNALLERHKGLRALTLVLSAVGAMLAVSYYFSVFDIILIVVFMAILVPYLLTLYVPLGELKPTVMYGIAMGVFVVALLMGFESARLEIGSPRSLSSIKIGEKGKDAEAEIKVRILRSGERGILYYNPSTQAFGLVPWDVVKRVDWPMSSSFLWGRPG